MLLEHPIVPIYSIGCRHVSIESSGIYTNVWPAALSEAIYTTLECTEKSIEMNLLAYFDSVYLNNTT